MAEGSAAPAGAGPSPSPGAAAAAAPVAPISLQDALVLLGDPKHLQREKGLKALSAQLQAAPGEGPARGTARTATAPRAHASCPSSDLTWPPAYCPLAPPPPAQNSGCGPGCRGGGGGGGAAGGGYLGAQAGRPHGRQGAAGAVRGGPVEGCRAWGGGHIRYAQAQRIIPNWGRRHLTLPEPRVPSKQQPDLCAAVERRPAGHRRHRLE